LSQKNKKIKKRKNMTFLQKIIKKDSQDEDQEIRIVEEHVLEDETKNNTETEETDDLVDDFFEQVTKEKEEKNEQEDESAFSESTMVGQESADGQLSVDVYQTEDKIVIRSTIAGVRPEDIDVAIDSDMVTIRGSRHMEQDIADDDYFYQECYWGSFSRSVILPMDVDVENSEAVLKNGVLTVSFPKFKKDKAVNIKIKEG
jgi:HSP20 family protein